MAAVEWRAKCAIFLRCFLIEREKRFVKKMVFIEK